MEPESEPAARDSFDMLMTDTSYRGSSHCEVDRFEALRRREHGRCRMSSMGTEDLDDASFDELDLFSEPPDAGARNSYDAMRSSFNSAGRMSMGRSSFSSMRSCFSPVSTSADMPIPKRLSSFIRVTRSTLRSPRNSNLDDCAPRSSDVVSSNSLETHCQNVFESEFDSLLWPGSSRNATLTRAISSDSTPDALGNSDAFSMPRHLAPTLLETLPGLESLKTISDVDDGGTEPTTRPTSPASPTEPLTPTRPRQPVEEIKKANSLRKRRSVASMFHSQSSIDSESGCGSVVSVRQIKVDTHCRDAEQCQDTMEARDQVTERVANDPKRSLESLPTGSAVYAAYCLKKRSSDELVSKATSNHEDSKAGKTSNRRSVDDLVSKVKSSHEEPKEEQTGIATLDQ